MRSVVVWACCSAAFLCIIAARPAPAQQEVYHPGETYDSLQAGQDAYWDAEAQRRALIGRQLMIQEQVMLQNTRSDPQDRSYGYVRQPIGHVKIWTGRLSYIYKPIYASPPLETARSVPAAAPRTAPPHALSEVRPRSLSSPAASPSSPPPPPRPAVPAPSRPDPGRGDGPDRIPPPPSPLQAGQEI